MELDNRTACALTACRPQGLSLLASWLAGWLRDCIAIYANVCLLADLPSNLTIRARLLGCESARLIFSPGLRLLAAAKTTAVAHRLLAHIPA